MGDNKQKLFPPPSKHAPQIEEEDDEYAEDEDQYEEEEEEEDFDANELLNLTDYQNKRRQQAVTAIPATRVGRDGVLEIESDGEEEDDGWGDDWGAPKVDKEFDYEKTDLNKLSQGEIAAHKKKMDEKFVKNQLRPGDKGFQYDKRVDFKSNKAGAAEWDEDDVDNYFDDDFM